MNKRSAPVGWHDGDGNFHHVAAAIEGQFQRVETGAGIVIVKMRYIDEPPDNIKAKISADEKARRDPHTLSFYAAIKDDNRAAFCSCGWNTRISDLGFSTKKAAEKEANRRHAAHLKEVRR